MELGRGRWALKKRKQKNSGSLLQYTSYTLQCKTVRQYSLNKQIQLTTQLTDLKIENASNSKKYSTLQEERHI